MVALPAAAFGAGQPPTPAGTAWILVDGDTGEVLAEHDADTPRPNASTTKMMTALIALESGDPDRLITVVPAAVAVGESSAGLVVGERISVRNLLKALLVGSGNDAAIALAYGVAGSEAKFVTRMNDRARALRITGISFANSHGLDEAGHTASPRALARLGALLMGKPILKEIVARRSITVPGPGGEGTRLLTSENDLLGVMPEADGVKTGHTNGGGYIEVAHATSGRLDKRLYAVLMGEPDPATRRTDSVALLTWGFAQFARPVILPTGRAVVAIPVQGRPGTQVVLTVASPVVATIRVDRPARLRVIAPSLAVAPLAAGAAVGRVEVVQDGDVVGRADLITRVAVPAPGFIDAIRWAFHGLGSVFT